MATEFSLSVSLSYPKGSLTCCKIFHAADSFASALKEGVLRSFVALKMHRFRPGLNPRTLGSVTSTLIITPPTTTDGRLILKFHLEYTGCDDVYSIILARNRNHFWALADKEMNVRIPLKGGAY
jgi:hypothetical protein